MRRALRGFLVVVLSVLVGGMAAAITPWRDCPKCHYSFPGPVPPPMVGGVATGTGFVVHSDGYVLTNHHVIEGSSAIKVMIGGREYTATVVESLPAQDLALLKIEARGLAAVSLGNSDLLQVGDDVFAIGCPGGVCGTVTAGRVANIGVTITVEEGKQLRGMLMVDITTDRGSSGGPLTNSRGEVVGITTAGKQGAFGFSIPINQAIPLLRRVPGFSVPQMGQATTELSFRAIRDRMTPVTAFIQTDQGTALELPPRYIAEYLEWFQCGDFLVFFGPRRPRCFVDEVVPPGYQLRGLLKGIADYETWTRRFPGRAHGPITYTRETKVWIIQVDSSFAATVLAASYCCPELLLTDYYRPYGDSCGRCYEENFVNRKLIFSGSVRAGGATVNRRITNTSPITLRPQAQVELTYSMVAAVDAFVVILLARAQLSGGERDMEPIWASETAGLEVGWICLLGTAPQKHVVLTYDAFIQWATAREKELLEFVLKQF